MERVRENIFVVFAWKLDVGDENDVSLEISLRLDRSVGSRRRRISMSALPSLIRISLTCWRHWNASILRSSVNSWDVPVSDRRVSSAHSMAPPKVLQSSRNSSLSGEAFRYFWIPCASLSGFFSKVKSFERPSWSGVEEVLQEGFSDKAWDMSGKFFYTPCVQ